MSLYKVQVALILFVGMVFGGCLGQLSPSFYDQTCPNLSTIVRTAVNQSLQGGDVRAGAKLIRFHFHDCFVNGCDGSVLLENAEGIESELDAPANQGIQGLDIVDNIKAAVEAACPAVVSCADILAIASRESVVLTGGPSWEVQLGRRDSRIANRSGALELVTPFETLTQLQLKFAAVGLDSTDLVALSGAHTFGRSRCVFFVHRLRNFNRTGIQDPTLDPFYRNVLIEACPSGGLDNRIAFDIRTPDNFDNAYFANLQDNRGLLQTDQELFSTQGADTVDIVNRFATSESEFFARFGQSMIKMGNIRPLTGTDGEIRLNCRRVNPVQSQARDVM